MIFANLKYVDRYNFLEKDVLECLNYTLNNKLIDLKQGSYSIDEENIFFNVVEYETKEKKERFWEAHRKYIDVHVMLKGEEKISLNSIFNLNEKEYNEEDDFLGFEGEENSNVILRYGDFLICYPEDAHMTAIKSNEKNTIKKVIFKVIVK